MSESAWARQWRPNQIPNGAFNSCANCHEFPGGPRNAFGLAVEAVVTPGSTAPFWSPALAALDSDGDGFTNGRELGDPAGTWNPGDPNPPALISLPGDPNSTPNEPPSVSLASPTNGAVFAAPASVTFEAAASDSDGTVVKVDFYDGVAFLGSATTAPFSLTAELWLPGNRLLTAVATDNRGGRTTSVAVTVTVEADTNALPRVDVTDRAFLPETLTVNVGQTVTWTSRGSLNHSVTSTEGLFSAGFLTNGDGSTYEVTFTNAGTYRYFCAYHTSGSISSQRGTIIVLPGAVPLVSIVGPTNGATFTTHDTITLTATASDPNGTVTQVDFFDGGPSGELLGTVTDSEVFSVTFSLPPGTHEITAVATDNENATTTSSPITLTVKTVAITNPIPERIPKGDLTIELRTVATNLISPLGMAVPDDGSGRVFVYDQAGVVWLMTAEGVSPNPVLDVRTNLVALGNYDERGLLGLAAHPDFAQHPLLYTYTSESNASPADFTSAATNHNHQSVIAEWRMDPANPNQVEPSSRREILRIDKPQSNHNGGTLRFGPDGFLYVSLGDGGRADDQGDGHLPEGNAQNIGVIYGKLLRLDVDGTDAVNGQYGIPLDNPFAGWGLVDEIYAYGLRNPFSFSFDRATGELYLADVGQNKVEEINLIVSGGNYGWRVKEGTFFFDPNGSGAGYVTDTAVVPPPFDLVDPIAQYDHDDGSAAVGGYVYRGTNLPALEGRYVFGDWGSFGVPSGRLFYLDETNAVREFRLGLQDRALGSWIKGFGEDADGELYVMVSRTLGPRGNTGQILKLVSVPEPVTITGVSRTPAGDAVVFTWNAVPGRSYQVQFTTDLNQANWSDLGGVLTATDTALSASDLISPNSQRLYRVVSLP
ncbi:MAG: PQQ-dependent sugar dehydrogenase [Verrucomicrobia bacterium]|nr:PQQ-dependent sugar dehydrogenase [Verrucomicrobiota bacterium]